MSEYVYDAKEDFLDRLETWEENGWLLEDIDAIREKVQRYDEEDFKNNKRNIRNRVGDSYINNCHFRYSIFVIF